MNYETEYQTLLLEVMSLRRKLRAERVKSTLASLAKMDMKSLHLNKLEQQLHKELTSHNRGERIDLLIEIIQDML